MRLFDAWQQTRRRFGDRVALQVLSSGETWTFNALQEELDRQPRGIPGRIVEVSTEKGLRAFVVGCLRCWRDGEVLMPVESTGQRGLSIAPALPGGTVHLKSTSGSTGRPQVIAFTADQLVADLDAIWETMGLKVDEPNLAVISAAHSYGFSNLVLPLLLRGMPVWQLADPLPGTMRAALDLARQCGTILTLPAVPAMWRAWLRAGVLESAPVGLAISAGAPLPLEVEEALYQSCGLKVHNFYGSSECGGIAFDESLQPRAESTELGRAMAGVQLDLGEEGCLRVRGAAVASGYLTPNPQVLGRGWFQTSDQAEFRNGKWYLRGRLADSINVAGRKVSPEQIEAELMKQSGVLHALALGIASQDPARVEEIVAVVHPEPGIHKDEIISRISEALPSWGRPRHWWWTNKLVPDTRGKLSRARWREAFLAGR